MKFSIIGDYYDFLSFYGSGNYHRLERCFNSSWKSHVEENHVEEISKNKKRAIRFLNTIGLLEIDYQKSNIPWVTCPGFLIFRNPGQVIAIGGSIFIDSFLNMTSSLDVHCLKIGYRLDFLKKDINFFPDLPSVDISLTDAQSIASKLSCRLIESPGESIAALFPTMNEALSLIATKMDEIAIESDLEIATSNGFIPFNSRHIDLTPKLLRKLRYDGRYDYLVRAGMKFQNSLYLLSSSDWASLVSYSLMDKEIILKFDIEKKLLIVPGHVQFPLLLERALFGYSLQTPIFPGNGSRIYQAITESSLALICSKISVFKIEVIK